MKRLAMDVVWAVPHHLLGEPVLPDGGMQFLVVARVFPHSVPEGHDGSTETGVRDSDVLWSLPRAF